MSDDVFERLARALSPDARRLLLMSETELERENRRTRAFIEKPRLPHPIRLLHARNHRSTRIDQGPSGRGLDEEQRELIRSLRFFASGVSETNGRRSERWIGPDGCIVLSFGLTRRFLSVGFEDGTRISMWPDIAAGSRKLLPTTEFMQTSPDLFDDYRRILEKAAQHMKQRGTRPLYRHRDTDLDFAVKQFYLRHQVATRFATYAQKQRLSSWFNEHAADLVEPMLGDEAIDLILSEIGPGAEGGEASVSFRCRSCEAKTAVVFDEIGRNVRCSSCDKSLSTADVFIDASSATMLNALVAACEVPLVLMFWARTAPDSVWGMAAAHDAALRSNARFVVVRVDCEMLAGAMRAYGVDELPTYIRFERGRETGRVSNRMSIEEVTGFGAGENR